MDNELANLEIRRQRVLVFAGCNKILKNHWPLALYGKKGTDVPFG